MRYLNENLIIGMILSIRIEFKIYHFYFMACLIALGIKQIFLLMRNSSVYFVIRVFDNLKKYIFLPIPSLVSDSTRAQNNLHSFLGGDRGQTLSSILDEEMSDKLTTASLQEQTETGIGK